MKKKLYGLVHKLLKCELIIMSVPVNTELNLILCPSHLILFNKVSMITATTGMHLYLFVH